MKLEQLLKEDSGKLAAIYLKGVKATNVLALFKGNFSLPRGREEEIVSETIRLIKAGFVNRRVLWQQIELVYGTLKLNGDISKLYYASSKIEQVTGDHAPASTKELKDAAITLQLLAERNKTLYGGIYKCKDVLDELAGLALKRYVRNNNERRVDETVSFMATMTLKGLGVWEIYQKALADGATI